MSSSPILSQIQPSIDAAYTAHMTMARGQREPLYPPTVLARAARTTDSSGAPDRDPLEYGRALRDSLNSHLASFSETYGVDVHPVLAATFLVNLLTEDNLPYYTAKNLELAESNESLIEWVREWTAEEDAHGVLMRDYALLSGLIADGGVLDHATYHAGRTQQMRSGMEIDPASSFHAFAYLTLQELLTKEAHNALSWLLDGMGRSVLRPISGDEQNHYKFYLALSQAALEVDPDSTLIAMRDVYNGFTMPGRVGIPDFGNLAAVVGISGVFDLKTIARCMQQVGGRLKIDAAAPVTEAGRSAQADLVDLTGEAHVTAQQDFMELLRSKESSAPDEQGRRQFVLGRTIDFEYADTATGRRIVGLRAVA